MNLETREQVRAGLFVILAGAAANILLIAFKIWGGWVASSQALIADGVHSISDLLSDAVVMLGLKMGREAEDPEHPFGHGRIETLASLFVGALLTAAAAYMAWTAIESLRLGAYCRPTMLAVWVAIFSILTKEALYHYTKRVGRRIRSTAVMSNAWHHRSDALSSVAALIGVAGAQVRPEWAFLDPVASLAVSLLIGKVGVAFAREALREFIDTAPEPEVIDEIQRCAYTIKGVRDVHDLRARTSGGRVFIEAHVTVDGEMTVREGHDVAKAVEMCLLDNVPNLEKAIIHVDPTEREEIS